jgi:hypothetical protein
MTQICTDEERAKGGRKTGHPQMKKMYADEGRKREG